MQRHNIPSDLHCCLKWLPCCLCRTTLQGDPWRWFPQDIPHKHPLSPEVVRWRPSTSLQQAWLAKQRQEVADGHRQRNSAKLQPRWGTIDELPEYGQLMQDMQH